MSPDPKNRMTDFPSKQRSSQGVYQGPYKDSGCSFEDEGRRFQTPDLKSRPQNDIGYSIQAKMQSAELKPTEKVI